MAVVEHTQHLVDVFVSSLTTMSYIFFRPTYCNGEHTLQIPMELFKQNRVRLCERLRGTGKVPTGAIVLLQGGVAETRNDSDHELLFRQVSLW